MITAVMDGALRAFERRACSPSVIERAARILKGGLGRGLDGRRVEAIQQRRLRSTAAYVARHSPFYRDRFDRLGVLPPDIRQTEDLQRLPFTTGADLHDWERFLCVPRQKIAAFYATAGTTGEPKVIPFTAQERLINLGAVALRLGQWDAITALIALPMQHGLWIGWAMAQHVVKRAGGAPLPVGTDDPQETLHWMRRLEPNVLFSAPSYLTVLTREAEAQGYRPQLDQILVGGETLFDDQRARFVDYWGARVFNSYGTTEIGGGQTIMLPECDGVMHLNDFQLLTEIVDPETGEPADEGELVFTTLAREAAPLLRYRTGDRARWAECDCWMPTRAIRLQGRVDTMIVVGGGMNLYGQVIARAIGKVDGTSGRVALEVDRVDLTDRLRVCVGGRGDLKEERVRGALFDAVPNLERNVKNGALILEIEAGADLSDQVKAVRVRDRRSAP